MSVSANNASSGFVGTHLKERDSRNSWGDMGVVRTEKRSNENDGPPVSQGQPTSYNESKKMECTDDDWEGERVSSVLSQDHETTIRVIRNVTDRNTMSPTT